MKITSKLATAVAILGLGLSGIVTNQVQNQPKEVQAAAKRPKKSKVHHYKKAHAVITWGPVINSNDTTKIDMDEGIGENAINGYKYVNGHKWYHIEEYGGKWINGISLKKPSLYTAKSNVTIYDVGRNNDGTGNLTDTALYDMPQTIVKKGTTIGMFSYLKPVNITSYQDPDTGDAIKFTGKKTVALHSTLDETEVLQTYHIEAGKYLEILLPNGDYGFIKARDISKFKKGGSSKAFKKLQDVSATMRGTDNVVKGGIKDAQWF